MKISLLLNTRLIQTVFSVDTSRERQGRHGPVQGTRKTEAGPDCACVDLKDAQHDSCELSFTWGKKRTAALETVPRKL